MVKYAAKPETPLFEKPDDVQAGPGPGLRKVNVVLMNTWLNVTESDGQWHLVEAPGEDGWVHRDDLKDSQDLKVGFVDVGQGDGALIECNEERFLIDGGEFEQFRNYLVGWQWGYELREGGKIRVDHVFVSHFDNDHYAGLITVIEDERFDLGTIYHNGIPRFDDSRSMRPPQYDTDLGTTVERTVNGVTKRVLTTTFDGFDDVDSLLDEGGLSSTFFRFLTAVKRARLEGRLDDIRKLDATTPYLPGHGAGSSLEIRVIGPVPEADGSVEWFEDSSQTRNGHSIVMRFKYGRRSLLFGGDLNTHSERHLLDRTDDRLFKVDVAKSCHHGSSDFLIEFMEELQPYATVISSGDNKTYAHPRADAIGCAGKYSRGTRPLVFSTEVLRRVSSGGDILYGKVNFRTDGRVACLSHMKETPSTDLWTTFLLEDDFT